MFQLVTFNAKPIVRHDTMEGREYLVAPMVMLVEGVHSGSKGPLYYPAEELAKTPVVWNHKPLVVYHPTKNTACDPDVLTSRKVGVIMNAKYEDKLTAEAWFEKDRVKAVDERILNALNDGTMMEISTGLFTDNDPTPGVWNGEKYVAIARNYRPDHLAILPDQVGACSIADGAGLLRNSEGRTFTDWLGQAGFILNELSFSNISMRLSALLRERYGAKFDGWIEDVYSDEVIYTEGGKLYRVGYKLSSRDVVELVGDTEEVMRKVQYATLNGKPLQGDTVPKLNAKETQEMERKTAVDELIANGVWQEPARAMLMALPEDQFALIPKAKPVENKKEEKKEEPILKPAGEAVSNAAKEGAKQLTTEEYVTNAPPEVQAILRNALAVSNARKEALVKAIMECPRNRLTENYLKARDLEELEGLAALAVEPSATPANNASSVLQPNYFGAGVPTVNNAPVTEKPLGRPTMNFAKPEAAAAKV